VAGGSDNAPAVFPGAPSILPRHFSRGHAHRADIDVVVVDHRGHHHVTAFGTCQRCVEQREDVAPRDYRMHNKVQREGSEISEAKYNVVPQKN